MALIALALAAAPAWAGYAAVTRAQCGGMRAGR